MATLPTYLDLLYGRTPMTGAQGSVAPRMPYTQLLHGDQDAPPMSGGFNPFAGSNQPQSAWSGQVYNRLSPTEQQGALGYARDVQGVDPTDVQAQMGRLAPGTVQGNRPRWSWL